MIALGKDFTFWNSFEKRFFIGKIEIFKLNFSKSE